MNDEYSWIGTYLRMLLIIVLSLMLFMMIYKLIIRNLNHGCPQTGGINLKNK